MDPHSLLMATLGGALIGASATGLLYAEGRIAGISGIVAKFPQSEGSEWRRPFVLGLLIGGGLLMLFMPAAFANTTGRSLPMLLAAGLLVGVGTRVSNGCTSGHGVCGLSRLAPRSAIAVATFMAAGFLTATVVGSLGAA